MSLLRPQEVLELAEITRETLRYWRKKVQPLRGKRGNQPCFTLGDVLALRVLNKLVSSGYDIHALSPIAVELFQKLNGPEWLRLEHRRLLICPAGKSVQLLPVSEPVDRKCENITLIFDLTANVLELRDARLGVPSTQTRESPLPNLIERKRRMARTTSKSE